MTQENGQQNAIVEIGDRGLRPKNIEGLWRVAKMVSASGLSPKGMQTPEKISVAMMYGAEIGLTPMQSIQSVAVVNGRPSIWGDAALALCVASPDFEDLHEHMSGQDEGLTAICEVKTKRRSKPVISEFSIADAKKAGLWGKSGPWTQYPKRMLKLRARGFALRDAFPDVLKGIYTTEEAMDIPSDSGPSPRVLESVIDSSPSLEPSQPPQEPQGELHGDAWEPEMDSASPGVLEGVMADGDGPF